MKVGIKQFDVKMELRYKGIELDVSDSSGNHVGDLVVNQTTLIWCPGKTTRKHGKVIAWDEFIQLMQARP